MFLQSVSTLGLALQNRHTIVDMQRQLSELLKEQGSGKKYDVAGDIGGRTASLIGMRNAFEEAKEYAVSNETIAARLQTTQSALNGIRAAIAGNEGGDDPGGFLKLVIAGMQTETGAELVQAAAQDLLGNLRGILNTNSGGRFLFAGTATDTTPVQEEGTVNPATGFSPMQVLQDVIAAKAPVTDTATLNDLLTGTDGIASVFDDTHGTVAYRYSETFYNGSANNVTAKVDSALEFAYGARADDPGIREIMKAVYTLAVIDKDSMPPPQYAQLLEQSLADLQEGLGMLDVTQGKIGLQEQTVEKARARHELTMGVLTAQINHLEAADPYETNVRILNLMSQTEVTFTLTGKIAKLSLINYL